MRRAGGKIKQTPARKAYIQAKLDDKSLNKWVAEVLEAALEDK